MILGVSGADHRDAGDELGIADLVPLLGQVEDHTELAVLHLGSSDIGLGQHGDGVFLGGGHLSGDLRGLAVVFDLHVLIGVQAVLGEQVTQDVLRRGALARGEDGAAFQVCKAVDGVTLFHHIQHAQRVDGQHLDAAVGLLVEGCRQVGRDGRHVQIPLDELWHDLIGRTIELQVVIHGGGAVLLHGEQMDQTHGGGAFQARDAEGLGRQRFCRGPAGQQADQHDHRQQQRCQFFHHQKLPHFLFLPLREIKFAKNICFTGSSLL